MYTVAQIATSVNGTVRGPEDIPITGVCDIHPGKKGCVSFLRSPAYERFFQQSKASAVIVGRSFHLPSEGKSLILVDNPVLAFSKALSLFDRKKREKPGIHSSAVVASGVHLGKDIAVGPGAVIEEGAFIGDGTVIGANAFVGSGVSIGNDSVVAPNVTLYHHVVLGRRVTIDAGTVIGADGFGWVTDGGVHHKIPQIGGVIIGDDVWIGSNCCVDRGTFKDTIIGEGSKLDNNIQVAHNVIVGKYCLFASQVGIAGSTTIGDYVTLAGQVGVVDHISIGDRCVVASKSAVMQSLKPGSFYSGIPARPHSERKRQDVVIKKLPDILMRLRKLEKELENYRSKGEGK